MYIVRLKIGSAYKVVLRPAYGRYFNIKDVLTLLSVEVSLGLNGKTKYYLFKWLIDSTIVGARVPIGSVEDYCRSFKLVC